MIPGWLDQERRKERGIIKVLKLLLALNIKKLKNYEFIKRLTFFFFFSKNLDDQKFTILNFI